MKATFIILIVQLWDTLPELIKEIGIVKGLLVFIIVLLFFGMQKRISTLYRKNIEDKQKEIDRLAKENHEYRDRFMKMLDDNMKSKKK